MGGNSLVDRIIPILGLKSETATTLNKPVGGRPVASLGLLNWNLSYETVNEDVSQPPKSYLETHHSYSSKYITEPLPG